MPNDRPPRHAGPVLAALLLLTSLPVSAGPAAWYVWRSRADASITLCAQTLPGPGWVLSRGPYSDVRCEQAMPRHEAKRHPRPAFEPDQTSSPSPGRP